MASYSGCIIRWCTSLTHINIVINRALHLVQTNVIFMIKSSSDKFNELHSICMVYRLAGQRNENANSMHSNGITLFHLPINWLATEN